MIRPLLIVIVILLAILAGWSSVQLSPLVFGQSPAVESTPLAEPTMPPSTIPAVPVPPVERPVAWLPLVFAGGECSEMAWYFCEVGQ